MAAVMEGGAFRTAQGGCGRNLEVDGAGEVGEGTIVLVRRFEDAGKPSGKFGECLAAVFEAQREHSRLSGNIVGAIRHASA